MPKTWRALTRTALAEIIPRVLGPINTYDQLLAAGGGVAISGYAFDVRMTTANRWSVWGLDAAGKAVVTDHGERGENSGQFRGEKRFLYAGRNDRMSQRLAAIAWAEKKYPQWKPFVRNTAGDYVPKAINDKFPIPKREKL